MNSNNLTIQRIVAIAGICLWVVFPIAMFISVLRQDKEALPPGHPHHKDTLKEYEEPKINDVGHQSVSLSPGPDHKHVAL